MARRAGTEPGETGARLRAAAERLFAGHGYAAVSMRRIAAEVGIGAGAIYHHVPDKQALLYESMRDHLDALLAAWDEADPGGGPWRRLDRFAEFHIRHHLTRGDAVFVAYMELRNLDGPNFERIDRLRRAYEDRLGGILASGAAAGTMHVPDARLASMALIAMLNGALRWYRPEGKLTLEEVIEIHLGMIRGAVGMGGDVGALRDRTG
jgi:AcrR family transcriptional regulator